MTVRLPFHRILRVFFRLFLHSHQAIDKANNTDKKDLDEEGLVNHVKPLLEQGTNILNEALGSIKALDPQGQARMRAQYRRSTQEASPEEHHLADNLGKLTEETKKTIDNAKEKIKDMPKAGPELGPLLDLMAGGFSAVFLPFSFWRA